jgi:hypothetical protein
MAAILKQSCNEKVFKNIMSGFNTQFNYVYFDADGYLISAKKTVFEEKPHISFTVHCVDDEEGFYSGDLKQLKKQPDFVKKFFYIEKEKSKYLNLFYASMHYPVVEDFLANLLKNSANVTVLTEIEFFQRLEQLSFSQQKILLDNCKVIKN